MIIDVDPERLGHEAQALDAVVSSLNGARAELGVGVSAAVAGCGTGMDGGLASALRLFGQNWDGDLQTVAERATSVTQTIKSLASLYGTVDSRGAQSLGG